MERRRLLSYDPGGGHTDQLRDLSLAIALAELLDRALVLPSYFHHRDVNVLTPRATVSQIAARRPPISSIVEVINTNVTIIDEPSVVVAAHEQPRCAANATPGCVLWLEPPEAFRPVAAALMRYKEFSHPWVHFHSMLDVLAARRAVPKRYPLATWEQQLAPGPCNIRYRQPLLAAAKRALRRALHSSRGRHLTAHVRALRRDKGKAECADEYIPRLQQLVAAAHPSPTTTLYIASDDLDQVLPRAEAALNRTPGISVVSARDAEAGARRRVHADDEVAAMALDMEAVLSAAAFSPAPRSGLSVHMSAMRACWPAVPRGGGARREAPAQEEEGAGDPRHGDNGGGAGQGSGGASAVSHRVGLCDPALATCVPFASSGCGGAFRLASLLSDASGGRSGGRAHGHAPRKWETKYFCPMGTVPPVARKCM